jgi:16S rRNA (cytosine967-C5)-methyltransferase
MTPQARLQSAIEILDLIIDAAKTNGAAADTIIAAWFKTRRFAGSGDRRAVRELVYRAIRAFGTRPHSGRAAFLGLGKDMRPLFDGAPYAPAVVDPKEAVAGPSPLSAWLAGMIDPAEHAALLDRAPLDLRVNTLLAKRDDVLANFPEAQPVGRDGIRLAENINIEKHVAFLEGLVDIQDAGSQLISQVCCATSGMTVVDLCAGAGGKTLALAADMLGVGTLIATDTNRDRLQRLPPRAERMGIAIIETRLLNPNEEFDVLQDLKRQADVVLVDAPCSGSGTWRRNPEARWRLTPNRLAQLIIIQAHVLKIGAALVKPGGALVYAVCSLIDKEGPDQIANFLKDNKGWTAAPIRADMGQEHGLGLRLSPAHDGSDGFFIARLERTG